MRDVLLDVEEGVLCEPKRCQCIMAILGLRALYSAVDLMQKEVEREKRRERLPANFGKPWTDGEDRLLTAEFDAGMPMGEIATVIDQSVSTISRELARNRGARGYRPNQAHNKASRAESHQCAGDRRCNLAVCARETHAAMEPRPDQQLCGHQH